VPTSSWSASSIASRELSVGRRGALLVGVEGVVVGRERGDPEAVFVE